MATYRKPLKDINGNFIIPAMTGDQTGWVKPADLENGDLYDKLVALDGTEITSNTDLNTIALCKPGMYYCNTNAVVSTLTNCPTTLAFTMRVFLPNSNEKKDPTVDSWVYPFREITAINGKRWTQRCQQQSGTPNTMTYYDWEPITTGEKVDIASTDIENHSGTILALVKGIYPEGYHRWFTETSGGTANITDKPTGSTNNGFVLEAFKVRDYTTTDYGYRLVCRLYNNIDTYEAYVGYSSSSITWSKTTSTGGILSATAVRDAGWSADKAKIPDMSILAYWNGAYSGTASNLQYFKNGSVTFDNLKTGSSGDYWTKAAGINSSGVTEAGKYIDFHNTAGSTNNYDVRLMVNSAGATTVTIPNKTGTMALTSDIRNTILRFSNIPTGTTTVTGTTNAGTAYSIMRTNYGTNNVIYTSGTNYFQKVRVTVTTNFNGTITSAYGVNGLKASTKIYAYWAGTKNGTNECNRSVTDVEGPSNGYYYGTAINASGNKVNTTISYEAVRSNSSGQWHLFGHVKSAGADNAMTFEIECTAVDNYTVPSVYQRGVPSSTNRNIVTIEILE